MTMQHVHVHVASRAHVASNSTGSRRLPDEAILASPVYSPAAMPVRVRLARAGMLYDTVRWDELLRLSSRASARSLAVAAHTVTTVRSCEFNLE